MNAFQNCENHSLESRQVPRCSDPHHSLAQFRALLKAGNYDAIVGRGLRRALRAAAADTSLEPEIGALRLTLVRLLVQESDLARLAASVARISSVAVQAARLRDCPGDVSEELRQALIQRTEQFDNEALRREQEERTTAPLPSCHSS